MNEPDVRLVRSEESVMSFTGAIWGLLKIKVQRNAVIVCLTDSIGFGCREGNLFCCCLEP